MERTTRGTDFWEASLAVPDRELEKRTFLAVAVAVLALLLLPWPAGEDPPRFELRAVEAPPLEEAALPEPPAPPPPDLREPTEVPSIVVPDPRAPEPEVPVEEHAEPVLEQPPPQVRPPSRGPARPPPRRPAARPVRLGLSGLEPPVLLHEPVPEYPPAAQAVGCGGLVVLEILIGTDGGVRSARVVSGPGCFGLEELALEAVAGRRYEPGSLEGRPVEVVATIRIRFDPA